MTQNERRQDFTWMVHLLINWAYSSGYKLAIGECTRTLEQQKLYVSQGKSKTLDSKHLQGLAVDVSAWKEGKYLDKTEDYKYLGLYWESLGGRWGGRFGDNPATEVIEGWDGCHFEYNK